PNGNLLTVSDAKNQTTTYTYDNMDRLLTRKDALNRTENYQYDLAGNLTTFTDRKNQVAQFQYDALNRRIGATYADGSSTTFTYDAAGRFTRASDTAPGAGAIDFAYDTLDRLIQEVTGQGSVAYQYDVLGRRTQMTANGQQPTVYQYDAASRLTRVEQGALFAALGYDNANRRTSLGYSNGTTTSYAYDVASRLTGIAHNGPSGLIDAFTYTYDAAGNRFGANRANGTASLLPSAVASATYDAANEQIAFGGATLTYDANGNLTNDGTNTYTWDAPNRLSGISGGVTANFSYDALGRRVSKTINGVTTQFLYDGNDIVEEISGSAIAATYVRSLNIDEPFGVLRQDGSYFYIYDGLGSTLALTNQSGAPAVQYSYEPFGNTQSSDPAFQNPFQFTGRENDTTGLAYYRARYYHPRLQRFMSEDPLRFRGRQPNLYVYVKNNPLNFKDPTGLRGCPCGEIGATTSRVGPLGSAIGYALAQQAINLASSMASSAGQLPFNTQFDAFRHCYWSCRMTQVMNPDAAAIIGYWHEECDAKQPQDQYDMDSYNNMVGRTFGMQGTDCRGACTGAMQGGVLQNSPVLSNSVPTGPPVR
ncbi:MAG: RHS repeat-associated core domain-containing protein, partial [Nitrospira defluvii]|nr:RHS repeat-associated core domain-containing protein [Nitrospira defluvii]